MKIFSFFFILTLFSACDLYESAVPMSNADASSIDSSIVGLWQVHNNEEEPYDMFVSIVPFNDTEYLVEYVTWDELNKKPTARFFARMYNSKVGNNNFYNVFLLDKQDWGSKRYTFFKYIALSPETLSVHSLSETRFKIEFSSQQSFYDHIKNNELTFNSTFDEWCVLVRSKKNFLN